MSAENLTREAVEAAYVTTLVKVKQMKRNILSSKASLVLDKKRDLMVKAYFAFNADVNDHDAAKKIMEVTEYISFWHK